ncbi:IMV A type inclusion-like protein P4c [Nile crocodilepox virus]|uniref:IMV A type inclusion-like protein P4c n=1 Tax=Nile crocodilepox virus (isolate Crocodylus niloticus/Zimbabwe/Ume/2001) TaxID=1289473 RepID=Q070A3_CPRVZ|nr:IMV A type inclusion-like protein P4c [Nile crocodilepox virus]ABJ09039.1 IMV A type inclusion-like protein P4c [Nile crocodilepox virus]
MAGAEPEWSELRELIYDLWQVKPEDYLFTRRDAKIIRNYFIKVMDSVEDPKKLLMSGENRLNNYINNTIFTTDANSDLYKKQMALQNVKRDTCTAGQFILKCVYYLVRLNNANNSLTATSTDDAFTAFCREFIVDYYNIVNDFKSAKNNIVINVPCYFWYKDVQPNHIINSVTMYLQYLTEELRFLYGLADHFPLHDGEDNNAPLTIRHNGYAMKFKTNVSELLMNGLGFTCKDKFSLKPQYEINVFVQHRLFLGDETYYAIVSGSEELKDVAIDNTDSVSMTSDISAIVLKKSDAKEKSTSFRLYVERRSLFFPMTVRGNILELTDHARSSLIGYNGATIIASNKISYPDVLPEPEKIPTIDKGLSMVVAENEGITETELAMLYQSFDEDINEVLDKVVQVADTHENSTNANVRQDGHLETIRKILVALNNKIDRVAASRFVTIM